MTPQAKLLQIATSLRENHSIVIKDDLMRNAAKGDSSAFDRALFMPRAELLEFVAKISRNWSVEINFDAYKNQWIMHKPFSIGRK